ncbi:MAG: hypothetical protein GY723_02160 [bacterium]|nr:hypothetical protein [bacterium]MCP5065511.1 hypothetical protein [bacterium]
MSFIRTSTCWLIVVLVGCTLACAHGDTEQGLERTPTFDFGVGAKVLLPGQSIPMPDPNQPRAGSPGAGEITFLGGSKSVERTERRKVFGANPSLKQAAKIPAAVVAAPVAAAVGAAKGAGQNQQQSTGPNQSQSQTSGGAVPPGSAPLPQAPATPTDPHRAIENARLAELERQLDPLSGGAVPPIPIPIPGASPGTGSEPTRHASVAPTGRSFSIADELAVLQAALPPKARPEDLAQARNSESTSETAPRRGGVADEVSDRNGDGRPDRWVYRHNGKRVRELFDEDGDSAPDRTVYFDPEGSQQSVEEDTNLDGRLDSWAEYRKGEMARQRRDTDFDGFLDTWIFYREGQITREEQDLNGDGFRNRMAFYANGKVVREREDLDGDGRIDRVTLYDGQQRIRRRDEDQDGDGLIDTRSYYENGRLSRRELLEEMLQESVDPETLTQPAWDEPTTLEEQSQWSDGTGGTRDPS